MKWSLGIGLVVALAHVARADNHEIAPVRKQQLKVDNCGVRDPAVTDDALRDLAIEHYTRGSTLYLQGDYTGAIDEFVASYCKTPYYQILKDIGQAYERNLDYELAIAYLERYVANIPDDAKRASQCDTEPKQDKENVARRVGVLRQLKAHILVQTQPGGATITLENARRMEARGRSGDDIAVPGDAYRIRVEKPGFETEVREIIAQIGKPYTYFIELTALTGTISLQVTPPDARVFLSERISESGLGDRLVGIGRYDAKLVAKRYVVTSESQGRITDRREIEVLPNQVKRVQIELTPVPQSGRRQLVGFSTLAGGAAAGALLYAFDKAGVSGIAVIAGGAAGLVGTYLFLPDDLALGTSNLTITATVGAAIAAGSVATVFTDKVTIVPPIIGASALLGAGAGYYLGERTKIRPGDAALVNSSMTWGALAGGLFALSFEPPREVGAGLVLSGLAMGTISGVIMTRYFDISRTHALLIDVGGIVGILGGLATESVVYQRNTTTEEQREHSANFALGGMAIGLIGAGILTRNVDTKLAVRPTIGNVTAADGTKTTTYGIGGSW